MRNPGKPRPGRPVPILIAIVVVAIAYWFGLVPGDSFRVSDSDLRKSDATSTTLPRDADATLTELGDLPDGFLRELKGREYLSPSGLIYGPGSPEGHRLDHLRRHTEDDPGRPGSHGVFDGGMAGALKTVDIAYERAKTGQRTTTEMDEGRTIHTVDLGRRVGYVGGSEGQRRGHPMARRVRLVLEGNHVVTAFPM